MEKRVILGLDVSTACIGACIVEDKGKGEKPEIRLLTHKAPKVSKKIKGIESLFLKKEIFEDEFISTLKDEGITDVIIEEPLLSSNNAYTVASLLRFNGMIAEVVYRNLGVVPQFISSYDARLFSFPDLVSLRKYNKKGNAYDIKHILHDLKKEHIVLYGAYPFDIDKKMVMMNKVNEMYPNIEWVRGKKGEIKKENYDACDSLICALAYININHNGLEKPVIADSTFTENEQEYIIEYTVKMWDEMYKKKLVLEKK